MKHVIFSDIHGNLEAFQSVLNATKGAKSRMSLGDNIGYMPDPHTILSIIQQKNIKSLRGNHEEAVLDDRMLEVFNPHAKKAIEWTRNNITDKDYTYIANLPYSLVSGKVIYSHGTVHRAKAFYYMDEWNNIIESFRYMLYQGVKIAFVGHTHVPEILEYNPDTTNIKRYADTCKIDENCLYIVNVGSVGQSRNGNPNAHYCIYDDRVEVIEIKTVQYDIDKTVRKIKEVKLPEFLANRLYEGR